MPPEAIGEFDRLRPSRRLVPIHHDEAVCPKFGDICERIAPHDSRRKSRVTRLDLLSQLDALANRAGFCDQFVAAHGAGIFTRAVTGRTPRVRIFNSSEAARTPV